MIRISVSTEISDHKYSACFVPSCQRLALKREIPAPGDMDPADVALIVLSEYLVRVGLTVTVDSAPTSRQNAIPPPQDKDVSFGKERDR